MFSFWLIFDCTTDKNTQYTTYLLLSYAFHEVRLAPVLNEWFSRVPCLKDGGSGGRTCSAYYDSAGIKLYLSNRLSSKCVWRVVNYSSRQDIKELHLNALHAYTWLSLMLSNPIQPQYCNVKVLRKIRNSKIHFRLEAGDVKDIWISLMSKVSCLMSPV